MTSSTSQRVAIYCRISQDRSGEALGIARQRERCEALAQARGWEVVGVYEDNDLSASSDRARPGFERLLAAKSTYDGILVYRLDRLLRSQAALVRVLEVERDIHTVEQGEIDVSTSVGRMFLTLLGSIAAEETEAKRQRLKAQRAQAAAAGAWHGRRCYGYEADGSIVEAEARIIRQVARDLLSGISLMGVTRWMNEQGATTITGKPWTPVLVRQMICAARLSGQREHTTDRANRRVGFGQIVARLEGIEPIIPTEWTAELRLLFIDRKRPTGVRQNILGGMIRCANCGSTLVRRGAHGDKASRWQCIKVPGTNACGSISAAAHRVEAAVDAHMIGILKDGTALDIRQVLDRHDEDLPTLAVLDSRRSALAVALAEGAITPTDFREALDTLATLRQKIIEQQTIHPWGRFIYMALELIESGKTVEEQWQEADDDRKRSMIALALDKIEVLPAQRRGAPWNPDRVVITERERR